MGNRTALFACHQEAGAKFVDFGGWDMPVRYSGTLVEHEAVRSRAGIFDVSHMGEVIVRGPEALDAVNRLITNDLHRIGDGRAQYTAMCTPDGGIVDDLIVYRVSSEELFLCVNASNREKDFQWIQTHLKGDATAYDESDDWSQIALQGPEAVTILGEVIPDMDWNAMRPFRFVDVKWHGGIVRVATTGYTGSGGVEIYLPNALAAPMWNALLRSGEPHGLVPAGLGARDTLRLEKGYCLYGNDIDSTTNPLEAGLQWVVRLDKEDFIGKAALEQVAAEGISRKLVGFRLLDRGIARSGYPVLVEGSPAGKVTSGTMSPSLKFAVGMAYIPVEMAQPGTEFFVEIRGKAIPAVVLEMPFL